MTCGADILEREGWTAVGGGRTSRCRPHWPCGALPGREAIALCVTLVLTGWLLVIGEPATVDVPGPSAPTKQIFQRPPAEGIFLPSVSATELKQARSENARIRSSYRSKIIDARQERAQLRARLREAKERIAELEAQLARLKAGGAVASCAGETGTSASQPAEKTTTASGPAGAMNANTSQPDGMLQGKLRQQTVPRTTHGAANQDKARDSRAILPRRSRRGPDPDTAADGEGSR